MSGNTTCEGCRTSMWSDEPVEPGPLLCGDCYIERLQELGNLIIDHAGIVHPHPNEGSCTHPKCKAIQQWRELVPCSPHPQDQKEKHGT